MGGGGKPPLVMIIVPNDLKRVEINIENENKTNNR